MGKKQGDPRGKQKGAQAHAEGRHGDKAHSRFLEEIQSPPPERDASASGDAADTRRHSPDSGHTTSERNEQDDTERPDTEHPDTEHPDGRS